MNPIQRAVEIYKTAHASTEEATRIAELERELRELRAGAGARTLFAKALGVTYGAVLQWINGDTAVSVRHYEGFERLTGGEITSADLVAFEQERLKAKAARKAS